MKTVPVQFPSGREVLGSYWGFLEDGGLMLAEPIVPEAVLSLSEGERLQLDVHIRTLKQTFNVVGRTVRRSSDGRRIFIAFAGRQGDAERMLNAAWADTHEVPQRKHLRHAGPGAVEFVVDGVGAAQGEVLDVSPGGLRLRGPARLPVGARVQVHLLDEVVDGKVRWSTGANEMGVEFSRPALGIVQRLINRGDD